MKDFYYANLMKDYFKQKLIDNPQFMSLASDDEVGKVSFLPLLANIMRLLERQNPTGLIYRDLVLEIFTKYQNDELDLFVIPEGFSINDETHIDWLYQALLYHYSESMKSYIGIIAVSLRDKISQRIATRVPIFISPIINKIIAAQDPIVQKILIELKDQLKIEKMEEGFDQILSDLFGSYTDEYLIQEYIRDFDLLLSYFYRPWGKTNAEEKTSEVLQNLREELGEKFNPLFDPLNVTLRNKLVHRNYYIDKTTKEIVYYLYNRNQAGNKIKYKSLKELEIDVIQLKFIRMNFFLIALTNLFKKIGDQSKSLVLFNALWNPIDANNLMRNIFGTDISLNLVVPECTFIEQNVFELRQIMNMKRGILAGPTKEYTREKALKEYWTKVFDIPDISKKHELLFSFFLFSLSMHPDPNALSPIIGIYVEKAIKKGFKVNAHNILQESVWALNKTVISLEHIKKLEINPEREEINHSIKVIEEKNYSKVIKNTALQEAFEEHIQSLKSLKHLKTVLLEEGKTLTGYQLSKAIRIKYDEDWPQPDFVKPGTCIRFAEKLGIVTIEERGDLFITLIQKQIRTDQIN